MVALSTTAAVTTRVGLGTSILLAAQRDPNGLAEQLATLDPLGRRATLGVGSVAGPGGRTGSTSAAATTWSRARVRHGGELDDEEAEYHGESIDFEPTWSWPKPARQPRVRTLVGGGATDAVFDAIAEWADGSISIGGRGWARRCRSCAPLSKPPGAIRARRPRSRWHDRRRRRARALRAARRRRGGVRIRAGQEP